MKRKDDKIWKGSDDKKNRDLASHQNLTLL